MENYNREEIRLVFRLGVYFLWIFAMVYETPIYIEEFTFNEYTNLKAKNK